MPKVNLEDFQCWCASANEYELISAKSKLLAEVDVGEKMIWAVNKRLDYLEKFNFENLTKGIDN